MGNDYTDFVGAKFETAAVSVGATSGPYELVAASASNPGLILGINLKAKTAGGINFQVSNSTVARTLSGLLTVAAGENIDVPRSPYPVFSLAAAEGLHIDCDANQILTGWITYRRL